MGSKQSKETSAPSAQQEQAGLRLDNENKSNLKAQHQNNNVPTNKEKFSQRHKKLVTTFLCLHFIVAILWPISLIGDLEWWPYFRYVFTFICMFDFIFDILIL